METSLGLFGQWSSMKKSTPSAIRFAKDSWHAAITTDGNVTWPSRRIAPPPVETVGVASIGGVVSMYGKLAVRPSAAFACTQSWYEVENERPVTVAVCWVESVAAVHKVGAVKPYAIREGTDSLVCHAIVALNGVSETVCTPEISIGVVFTGAGGVVVVGGGGVV